MKGQAIGVAEDPAEVALPGLLIPDEIAPTSELTAPEGRVAVGLAAIELKTEDNEAPIDADGLLAKELMADDKAGAAVTAGSDNREEISEETAGLVGEETPTPAPIPAPIPPFPIPTFEPDVAWAATEEAASTSEEAAAVGSAAPAVLAAMELSREEISGLTVTEGLPDRKLRADEAAAPSPDPDAPLLASGAEVAAAATPSRREDSWEAAAAAAASVDEPVPDPALPPTPAPTEPDPEPEPEPELEPEPDDPEFAPEDAEGL